MSTRNVKVRAIKNLPVGKNLNDYVLEVDFPLEKSCFEPGFVVPKDKLDELIRNGAIITY